MQSVGGSFDVAKQVVVAARKLGLKAKDQVCCPGSCDTVLRVI